MKCPRCWSEKAYLQRVKGWRRIILPCLLLRPMKCHHCYHKFPVFWFSTIGRQIKPPQLPVTPVNQLGRPSYAAQNRLATRTDDTQGENPRRRGRSTEARAA